MIIPSMSIGAVSRRSGVAASALRFYEAQGFIKSGRSRGGRRMFSRDVLRRIAFIRAAQSVGLTLAEIRSALATLPNHRTPTRADWRRMSSAWRPVLDRRIDAMIRLRDSLSTCIGCGCLSLKTCALYNPGDTAYRHGAGPRFLIEGLPAHDSLLAEAYSRKSDH